MKVRGGCSLFLIPFVLLIASCGGSGGDSDGSAATYTVGGTVSGLAGTGLALQINGVNTPTTSSGTFVSGTSFASGAAYSVTVLTHPTNPSQTCTVSNGSGAVGSANVTNVVVNCATNTYTINATVSGLAGTGLVLRNNGGDDLPVSANGAFAFATPIASGSNYAVTVFTQPSGPTQSCTVTSGTGTVGGANITNVVVNCATNTYTVSATVSGLAGTGLVLRNNGGNNLPVSANGTFAFAPIASGANYAVTVFTQPSSPTQTCTVTGGTGTVGSSNVNVAIACTTNTFAIGGTVSGLTGTGLVLRNNGGNDLPVSANGTFAFSTPIASGANYAVTVATQPSGPTQSCTVSNGSGAVGSANVTNVVVNCATNTYTVSATVSGLAGTGLVLRNNGGNNLPVSANGTFAFSTPIASGSNYAVTVFTQPSSPTQTCTVTSGTGTVGSSNVNVAIACTTNTYTIGGTLSGLTGTGLVLRNNGGNDLPVSTNGTFAFTTPIASGANYAVTASTQPTNPSQTCTVSNGSGAVGSANVTNVVVNCAANTYTIGGTVSGLTGTGLVVRNNGGNDLPVSTNGTFAFTTPIASGANYAVTVATQPSGPTQSCTVTSGSGTVGSANVTNVVVNCTTNTYTINAVVSGLAGTGLVLRNNGGNNLPVSANGTFAFTTPIASGAAYSVTVLTQPTNLSQTCTVTSGSGTVGSSNVNVAVACTTNTFAISGTVSGYNGTGLTLRLNGTTNFDVGAGTTFAFPAIPDGSPYNVTVLTPPIQQTCTVANGSGTLAGANVTNVVVNCTTNTYTINAVVSGLAGTGLVLRNNGGNDLPVSTSGTFAFTTPIASGSNYAVTVATQPSGPTQTCTVTSGSGTVGSSNVNVAVACTTNTFAISGTVSGYNGTGLTLRLNGTTNFDVGAGTTFAFPAIPDGSPYNVTVLTPPIQQTCTVANGSGTLAGANISNVTVTCTTNTYTVGGTVSGLTGTGLVLRNNGGDDLPVSADGTFAFSTPIASGSNYAVTVATQPSGPTQTCTVTSGSGTVGSSNVTNVAIACTTNTFAIGGTLSGLTGTGLVLRNNGGDDLPVSGSGTFAFTTPIASGAPYAVTVATQPSGPTQTCTVTSGTGTVGGANVANVVVNCATNTYTIGGTVSGLTGTGLVLRNNGGDDLPVSADGTFAFATPIASGAAYAVTVATQPSGPIQTCTVTSGTGTVGSANVTSVAIACTAVAARFAYVANDKDNSLAIYVVDTTSGRLKYVDKVPTGTSPDSVSVDPSGRYAYVANEGSDSVSQYAIGANGSLTEIATAIAAGTGPVSVAVDPSGRYAYVANTFSNNVSQYAIGTNGSLTEIATAIAAGTWPASVAVDPSGKYVYVANSTSNNVSQYAIGANGSLTEITTAVAAGTGPASVALDPSGKYAYVANSGSDNVSQYAIGANGSLSQIATAVAAGTGPASVALDPSGKYAYVANSGSDNVSQYAIGANGSLTEIATAVAAGSGSRSVGVDPSGKYAYVGNFTGNNVSQYAIGANGSLSAISPATVVAKNGPFALAITHGSVAVAAVPTYAYAANIFGDNVSQYAIGANGSLTEIASAVAAGSAPFSVTVAPSGKYAYVTNSAGNSISQYAIGTNGSLTEITTAVAAGLAPVSVAVEPSGKYAYAANENGNSVSQYEINATGSLAEIATAVAAGLAPVSVAVDPSGKYVYVANEFSNSVSQYAIGANGGLTEIATAIAAGAHPVSIAVDPSGKYVFVANNSSNDVSQYAIGANGTLTEITTAVAAGSGPYSVMVDPSGKYAYVANNSGNSISQYAIGANGSLTEITTAIAAGTAPAIVAVDPSGKYAYVTNNADMTVSQYAIGADGSLTEITTAVAAGLAPIGVTTVGTYQ